MSKKIKYTWAVLLFNVIFLTFVQFFIDQNLYIYRLIQDFNIINGCLVGFLFHYSFMKPDGKNPSGGSCKIYYNIHYNRRKEKDD